MISAPTPWDKTSLIRTNDGIQKGAETQHKDFGEKFENSITKTNGSELMDRLRMMGFWNKTNKSPVETRRDSATLKPILKKIQYRLRHRIPTFLEENRVKAIRARGFPRFTGSDNGPQLLHGRSNTKIYGYLRGERGTPSQSNAPNGH